MFSYCIRGQTFAAQTQINGGAFDRLDPDLGVLRHGGLQPLPVRGRDLVQSVVLHVVASRIHKQILSLGSHPFDFFGPVFVKLPELEHSGTVLTLAHHKCYSGMLKSCLKFGNHRK